MMVYSCGKKINQKGKNCISQSDLSRADAHAHYPNTLLQVGKSQWKWAELENYFYK